MTIQFLDHGDHFCIGNRPPDSIVSDHLPAAVYDLKLKRVENGVTPAFSKRAKQFNIPEKRFGRHERLVSRIIADYDPVNPPLGAIAIGVKGSGKTILMEDICNRMISRGHPIVFIAEAIPAEILREVARAIPNAVFFFDEFGKLYHEPEARNSLLTFFGDRTLTGRMFLVTANSFEELSEFMINRPGRFAYRIEMQQMERDAFEDFLKFRKVPANRTYWLEGIWRSLTFDLLNHIARPLLEAKDYQDFVEELSIVNTIRPVALQVKLDEVTLHGAKFDRRRMSAQFNGPNIEVRLFEDLDRTQLIDTLLIPWQREDGMLSSEFSVQGNRWSSKEVKDSGTGRSMMLKTPLHTYDGLKVGDYVVGMELDVVDHIHRLRPEAAARLQYLEGTNILDEVVNACGLVATPEEEEENRRQAEERKRQQTEQASVQPKPQGYTARIDTDAGGRGRSGVLIHVDDAGVMPESGGQWNDPNDPGNAVSWDWSNRQTGKTGLIDSLQVTGRPASFQLSSHQSPHAYMDSQHRMPGAD